MIKLILLISTLSFFVSCSNSNNKSDEKLNLLDNIYGNDTLTIKVLFADCEEWGGHTERMDIYRKDNKTLMLNYQKDTVNCPDPDKFDRKIIDKWTTELSETNQVDILNFIHELTDMSFKDEGISNASNYYIINRNISNLKIEYSNYGMDWSGFKDLKSKITTANKL